jgi:hypothetical protein
VLTLASPAAPSAGPATRVAVALLTASLAVLLLAAPAFAVSPTFDGSSGQARQAAITKSGGGGHGGGSGGHGGGGTSTRGYDVSYPQCGSTLPGDAAFAIVGVNGGIVYRANPCLADELAWAGGTTAELYANTANPGPDISSYWPYGQTSPRFCDPANPDSADCAFDYGWNAAADSYATAVAAYQTLGLKGSPAGTTWWLDVETSNSWRDDTSLNVAALQGAAAYLLDEVGVANLGFYSTTYQWGVITGGTTVFADHPSWGAGARSEKVAKNLCTSTTTSFTGGPLVLVQYPYSGLDADLRC